MTMEINPPSYADVRLILGDQRSGKSCTGVAYAKDDYYDQLTGLISPTNQILKARSLDRADKEYLEELSIFPDVFKYVRAFTQDSNKSKIIAIPKGWFVQSPVRIFSNFHVYGLKAVFITLADMLEYFNSDLFTNAWLLSDESAFTDPRNSMTGAGKLVAQFGATVGKRNLHFCQMTQYNNMIEVRFRQFATTRVLCSYEESTKMITCEIRKRGETVRSVSYYAPRYWMNFDTTERIKAPELMVARARESVAY
jgi:hypothetical protein